MNPTERTRSPIRLARQAATSAVVLLAFLAAGSTALAVDQPPETAPQQRAWLLSHLVTDMQSVGSFTSEDIARMATLVNSLSDDQASLLARFYYLTREKTEEDARLYTDQQTDTDEALAQAKAQVADLLTQLQNQIEQTYSQLATTSPGCETLCQVAYASVPGWCAYNQYAIPDWYYGNGCYLGPVCSAGYCGAYAVPVYNTFYNRASRYNYWNSRAYVHNNITRVGHHGTSLVQGSQHGLAVTAHHDAAQVLKASRSPLALAKHNNTKLHVKAAGAKNHALALAGSHAKQARPASHPKTHAAAHSHPKAAHPKAHAQHAAKAHAVARSHPKAAHPKAHAQHVAHSHPQHAARAHAQSGHGRHK